VAFLPGGGAWWQATAGSPEHAKTTLPGTKQNGKGTKIKRGARGFHRAAQRGRRGVGGGDRRRGWSSGSAFGVAARRESESSGERCGLERCSGAAFYSSRRGEEGAPEVVGGGTPAATIKARWSFSGWLLREGEQGEGAGRRWVSARRTRGEGQEARGRGRGAGEAAA
jgi:hypothetical protein